MKVIKNLRYRLKQGWNLIEAISITNWLKGFQAGKNKEQERIIQLLEKNLKIDDWLKLIALIKGEQK